MEVTRRSADPVYEDERSASGRNAISRRKPADDDGQVVEEGPAGEIVGVALAALLELGLAPRTHPPSHHPLSLRNGRVARSRPSASSGTTLRQAQGPPLTKTGTTLGELR